MLLCCHPFPLPTWFLPFSLPQIWFLAPTAAAGKVLGSSPHGSAKTPTAALPLEPGAVFPQSMQSSKQNKNQNKPQGPRMSNQNGLLQPVPFSRFFCGCIFWKHRFQQRHGALLQAYFSTSRARVCVSVPACLAVGGKGGKCWHERKRAERGERRRFHSLPSFSPQAE